MNELTLAKILEDKKKIWIYGAGMVGSLVLLRLRALGFDEEKLDFVVSKATPQQSYYGHRVLSLENCELGENHAVIVATMPKNQGQIVENLKSHGINDFITIDDELYDDMEREYIGAFIKARSEEELKGDVDVLFMSSDNNFTSGAFLCMIDLCKGMQEESIKPLVVLPCYGNGERLLIENGIDYTYIRSKSGLIEDDHDEMTDKLIKNSEAINEIENLIRKHHVKLVHNNTNHTYVGCVAANNLGVPYVWHVRENVKEQGLRFFDEDYIYTIINNAARIVTVSKYIENCYPRIDREKTVCIYDGVEANKYYYKHTVLQNDKLRILMPGIMVPLKGQHQLLQAAVKLKDTNIDFDITFVGSGDADYVKSLENVTIQNDLQDRIHFFERVSNLEEWYKKADIVAVCSRSEAFGRVTVEAQLSGCIVIGAACGATQELITNGETGYLYELDNIEMLVQIITEINDNREKASVVALKGQEKAYQLYDKTLNCKRIISEYNTILRDRHWE